MNVIYHVCVCMCVTGSPERVEAIMDEVERYITLQLYEQAFCPESADDEVKDLAVQKRIRWDSSVRSHTSSLTICHLTSFREVLSGLVKSPIESVCIRTFRSLHWVTVQMLRAPLQEEIPAVTDSLDKAITGKVFVVEAF